MMRTLAPLLLLLGLFGLPASANEPVRCEIGKIRRMIGGKQVVEKSSFCYNWDRTSLMARSCAIPRSKCRANETTRSKEILRGLSAKDKNPGFTLCRKMGGRPELIEFLSDGTWYELDRCYFAEDGSYRDTAHLFLLLKNSGKAATPSPASE